MERLAIKVLQRRMVIFSVLALLLTGGAVAASAILPLGGLLNDAARDRLAHVHALTSLSIGQHVRTLEGLALQVTSRSAIRDALEAYLDGRRDAADLRAFTEPKLADAMQLSPLMIGITRRAPDGRPVASVGRPPPPGLMLPAPAALPLLVGPVMDDGAPVLAVVAPINAADGRLLGSDVVVFSANGLAPILTQRGLHQCYLGRSADGRVTWYAGDGAGHLVPAAAPMPLIASKSVSIGTYPGSDGTAWVTVGGPQGGTAWHLLTAAPAADVFAEVRSILGLTAIATAVAVGLGALVLLLILRPLSGTLVVHAEDMSDQLDRLRDMRRDLEEERRRLAESNADLEQFAYAASHDLQQPLRMISGFLDLLRRRYDDRLDAEGREFIGHAVDGARQLRAMIQGLLEYSRVGRLETAHRPCDLPAAAQQAVDLLGLRVAETDAVVDIGPLPTLEAEPQQMVRLFQTLIDNALKYRHDDRPPRVSITAEPQGEDWCIRVRDNGIGMDEHQARQAFGLFSRLHPKMAVEGTGLGLALCQKIAHRHGGEITLDSTEGEGTTFSIWLPRRGLAAPASGPGNNSSVRVEHVDDVAGLP